MRLNKGDIVLLRVLFGKNFALGKISTSLYNFCKPIALFFNELNFMGKTGMWDEDYCMDYFTKTILEKMPEMMATEVAKLPSDTAMNPFYLNYGEFMLSR